MIERDHALPLARQAAALGISRGSLYYAPWPVSTADLAVMRRIDQVRAQNLAPEEQRPRPQTH
jgi:putative transposase